MSEIKVNSIKGVSATSAAISINNTDGTCTANITNNLSNRNVIKNSAMQIAQRGYSFSSVSATAYHLDRFQLYIQNSSAAFAVSQNTDSPDGFGQSLKIDVSTADTSIASNEEIKVIHKLEGFDVQRFMKGSSAAKRFTLSFYVKATKTGVYIVELYDRDNNRDVSGSYTVSDTNWNRYTIDFPADTTGAFGNDNGSSLEINFWLVAGSAVQGGTLNTAWRSQADASSATGQVNFTDSTSNDWLLTGVQLEATDNGKATDFEHIPYGQDLALCQRYYYRWTAGAANKYLWMGMATSTSSCFGIILELPVTMRATPTASAVGTFDPFGNDGSSAGHAAFSSTAIDHNTVDRLATTGWSGASGISGAGQAVVVRASATTDYIDASAEL
jgi:hypothetical protein